MLKNIPFEFVSFTLDDSIVSFKKNGEQTMYTKETLVHALREYNRIEDFLDELTKKHYCVEVQLWNDDYCH